MPDDQAPDAFDVRAREQDVVRWLERLENELRQQLRARQQADDTSRSRIMELTVETLLLEAPPDAAALVPGFAMAVDDYEDRRADVARLESSGLLDAESAGRLIDRLGGVLLAVLAAQRHRFRRLRLWSAAGAVVGALTWLGGSWAWLAAARDPTGRSAQLWCGVAVLLLGAAVTSVLLRGTGATAEPLRSLLLLSTPAAVVVEAVVALVSWAGRGLGSGPVSSTLVVLAGALLLVLATVREVTAPARSLPVGALGLGVLATPPDVDQSGRLLSGVRAEILQRRDEESRAARSWQLTHLVVGAAASAASAGAAAVVNASGNESLTTVLAVLGALLSGVVTAVNPGRRFEVAHTVAQMCAALNREVVVLLRADFGTFTAGQRREALEDVVDRFEKAIGVTGRDGFWRRRRSPSPG